MVASGLADSVPAFVMVGFRYGFFIAHPTASLLPLQYRKDRALSNSPIVIGDSCDDQINYGETVDIQFTYANEDGTPIDLTTATVSIFSSTPSVIQDEASITITDPTNGVVRMILDRTNALQLRKGRNNRFRVQMIFGPDSDDVTPDIYLQVT
jgi:hypothetical protein